MVCCEDISDQFLLVDKRQRAHTGISHGVPGDKNEDCSALSPSRSVSDMREVTEPILDSRCDNYQLEITYKLLIIRD